MQGGAIMFNFDALTEIKVLKETPRQRITLVQDADGKKFLKRELEGDKREIFKKLMQSDIPGVPKIFHVELADKTAVVEEYADGSPITGRKFTKREIRRISKTVLSSMEKLHELHIIHRDIKPDHILVNDSCSDVWLTDFDISRIYREEVRKDTETLGTFGYAPIEQFGMLPTDFKTDIYAVGASLKSMLDSSGIKGGMMRIAEKCKRLDPSLRYKNAKTVKRALMLNSLKLPLFILAISVLLVFGGLTFFANSFPTSSKPDSHQSAEDIQNVNQPHDNQSAEPEQISENNTENTTSAEVEKSVSQTDATTPPANSDKSENTSDEITFEGDFYGFAYGAVETEYRNYDHFFNVCTFSSSYPMEHVLMLEDISKSGKLKLGKNNTVIDAAFTLSDGTLTVNLNDNLGHTFSNSFRYDYENPLGKSYTDHLRKNADIICYDLDEDGGTELLFAVNEGSFGVAENQIFNPFNYCAGWCIRYDESTGFILCSGNYFSEFYPFELNEDVTHINVYWDDVGDPFGYTLRDNNIEPI